MILHSSNSIQQQPHLKQSFFQLTKEMFEIDLHAWDAFGYWNTSYRTHCIEQDGNIISNVATSDAFLLLDDRPFQGKQIGTVMTAKPFQRQGFATTLMEHVLEKNKDSDYLFLFANKYAASFYEQFGFERVQQQKFSIPTEAIQFKQTEIKKLNFQDDNTRTFILDMLIHRLPISTKLGVLQNEMIVMFHIISNWQAHLYYLPALQTIVIGQQIGDVFVLADVISKQPILLKELLPYLNVKNGTIQLGFTPSSFNGVDSMVVEDDFFYVKNQCDTPFPTNYYFPDLARA